MASNFEYTGDSNHQAGFREKATGVQYWLNSDGAPIELLDDDEVLMTASGQRAIFSIREQRIVRWP